MAKYKGVEKENTNLNNEVENATQAVIGLKRYAEYLSSDIEKYNDKIRKLASLIDQIACFYGIEGDSPGCTKLIQNKYIVPICQLLDGKSDNLCCDFKKEHQEAILVGLKQYKDDLIDAESDYVEEVEDCEMLMKEVSEFVPEFTGSKGGRSATMTLEKRYHEAIHKIGISNLLNLPIDVQAILIKTNDLETKVKMLEKIVEQIN